MEKLREQVENEIERVYANKDTKEVKERQSVQVANKKQINANAVNWQNSLRKKDDPSAMQSPTNLNEDLMGLETLEAPDQALPPPFDQEEAQEEEDVEVMDEAASEESEVSFRDENDSESDQNDNESDQEIPVVENDKDVDELDFDFSSELDEADQALPPEEKPEDVVEQSASKFTAATNKGRLSEGENDSSFELCDDDNSSSDDGEEANIVNSKQIQRHNSHPIFNDTNDFDKQSSDFSLNDEQSDSNDSNNN